MNRQTDIYHRWVAWSEEDQTYNGRCPDLFHGGVHGYDPLEVARELQKVIDEWEAILESDARQSPPARVTAHDIRDH
jgi:predicted RNase H-like HicB family nuclease